MKSMVQSDNFALVTEIHLSLDQGIKLAAQLSSKSYQLTEHCLMLNDLCDGVTELRVVFMRAEATPSRGAVLLSRSHLLQSHLRGYRFLCWQWLVFSRLASLYQSGQHNRRVLLESIEPFKDREDLLHHVVLQLLPLCHFLPALAHTHLQSIQTFDDFLLLCHAQIQLRRLYHMRLCRNFPLLIFLPALSHSCLDALFLLQDLFLG